MWAVVVFLDFGGQRSEAEAAAVPGPVRTGDDVKAPAEIIFEVTEAAEGGYDARALGYSIAIHAGSTIGRTAEGDGEGRRGLPL